METIIPHKLGLDINGVLLNRENRLKGPIYSFHAIAGAFVGIRRLIQEKFGAENVYLVSKSLGEKRMQILEFFEKNLFYEDTGILRSHVYFCEARQDKAPICRELGITHFVDDRLEVLQYLRHVPNRYLFQKKGGTLLSDSLAVRLVSSWDDLIAEILPSLEISVLK